MVDSVKADNISMTSKLSGRGSGAHAENFEHNMVVLFAEYNRPPEDLLKQEFYRNGREYSVIRVEPRNPKYPILARGLLDNLVYKFRLTRSKKRWRERKKCDAVKLWEGMMPNIPGGVVFHFFGRLTKP